MADYKAHNPRQIDRPSATIVARVSEAERAAMQRLANTNDRTISREVRRAIRLYVMDPAGAERTLRAATGAAGE